MAIFNTALFLFIITIIIYALINRNSKLEIEKGLNPIFTEFCCRAFDGHRAKFLIFSIYQEFIVIGYARSIVIKANEIKAVGQESYFGKIGLAINHTRTDLPTIVLFLNYGLDEAIDIVGRLIKA